MEKEKLMQLLAVVVILIGAIYSLIMGAPIELAIAVGCALIASLLWTLWMVPHATKDETIKHILLAVPLAIILVAGGYPIYAEGDIQTTAQYCMSLITVLFVSAEILEKKLFAQRENG